MAIYEYDLSHTLTLSQILDIAALLDHYGTILGGDLYFSKRLRAEGWETANNTDKLKALYEATSIIDRLNYSGSKYAVTQLLQFPRGTDTTIPDDIHNAAYEIAILLLEGLDPQREADNLNIKSEKVSSFTTEYSDRLTAPPHVSAGIYSVKAWRLLFPYLRCITEVSIVRV